MWREAIDRGIDGCIDDDNHLTCVDGVLSVCGGAAASVGAGEDEDAAGAHPHGEGTCTPRHCFIMHNCA